MLDKDLARKKLNELHKHLKELEPLTQATLSEYRADYVRRHAAEKLVEAGDMLAKSPNAMQLRYFTALHDVAGNRTSTIVFPIPIDLLSKLQGKDG